MAWGCGHGCGRAVHEGALSLMFGQRRRGRRKGEVAKECRHGDVMCDVWCVVGNVEQALGGGRNSSRGLQGPAAALQESAGGHGNMRASQGNGESLNGHKVADYS